MSVRAKLVLALAPLVAALLGIGLISAITVSGLGENSAHLLRRNSRSVLAAYRMRSAIGDLDRLVRETTPAARSEQTSRSIAQLTRRFDDALRTQGGAVFEPGEQVPTERLRGLWAAYRTESSEWQRADRATVAGELDRSKLAVLRRSIERATDEIVAVNQRAMAEKGDRARTMARRANVVLMASLLVAFASALPLSLFLVRLISRRIGLLTATVERVDAGDFAARVALPGGDEIAVLASRVNDLATHLDDYRRSSAGELLEAERSTQATIDTLPDPVVVFGVRGHVLKINRAAEEQLALPSPLGVREPLATIVGPLRDSLERARDDALALGARAEEDPARAVPVSVRGEVRLYLPRATPVLDGAGEVIGVTVVLQDVTELRRFDEARNDLVATVAHELRTPLTSLRMAIHLCLDGDTGGLTGRQMQLLETARAGCDRLQAIVAELLDLARIQTGRLELRRQPSDAMSLIRDAVSRIEVEARERSVRIRIDAADPRASVLVDPERIALLLSNLLGNAVRHSPAGAEVVVRIAPAPGVSVRVSITDSGGGIPVEQQPYVFDKFHRVPGSAAGGVGLGLAIARGIVLAHGGAIGVESEAGRGAEFWFTLPVDGD